MLLKGAPPSRRERREHDLEAKTSPTSLGGASRARASPREPALQRQPADPGVA